MTTFRRTISNLLIILVATLTLYPVWYWLGKPELTEMQLFIKFWKLYILAVCCAVGYILIDEYKHPS